MRRKWISPPPCSLATNTARSVTRPTTKSRNYRAEDGQQRTEDRGQRAEDRGQRAEVGEQKTEGRGQRAEDRGQRSENRRQKTEGWKRGSVAMLMIICETAKHNLR